jgi:hypothetical protein
LLKDLTERFISSIGVALSFFPRQLTCLEDPRFCTSDSQHLFIKAKFGQLTNAEVVPANVEVVPANTEVVPANAEVVPNFPRCHYMLLM